MASLKFEYPYIKFLTRQEKADYQSDLPENMDDFQVFHIKSSPIYDEDFEDYFKPLCYRTPEEVEKANESINSTQIWCGIVTIAMGRCLSLNKELYKVNVLANYITYSAENWPQYFKRRISLIGMTGMMLSHFYVFGGKFANYPKIFS